MSPGIEPRFLTRATVEAIHEEQIDTYGGLHGVRDENTLESAIAAAQNVYLYGGGDMYEVAAAYAYHLGVAILERRSTPRDTDVSDPVRCGIASRCRSLRRGRQL